MHRLIIVDVHAKDNDGPESDLYVANAVMTKRGITLVQLFCAKNQFCFANVRYIAVMHFHIFQNTCMEVMKENWFTLYPYGDQ